VLGDNQEEKESDRDEDVVSLGESAHIDIRRNGASAGGDGRTFKLHRPLRAG